MTRTKCFILVPVPMIKELMTRTDGINVILMYGLYHSARKQKTTAGEPFRQLLYCYFRETDVLTPSLKLQLDNFVDEGKISDDIGCAFGSYGSEFSPETEVEELSLLCKENLELQNEILEWYKIVQFYKLSNLALNGNAIAATISCAKKFGEFQGEPYAMISPNLMIDLRDKGQAEKDRVRMAMLLAICSIVGTKRFAATTKKQIIKRMFGAKNDDELSNNLLNKSLNSCFSKYTTRKVFDKIRDELLAKNLLKCYHGHAGRIYISNKFSFSELLDEIVDFIRKSTSPSANWRQNEKELMKRLTDLNKGTTLINGASDGASVGTSVDTSVGTYEGAP